MNRMRKARNRLYRGLGIGAVADGCAEWQWASKARWWLSYNLRIGHWFFDGRDVCWRCDATPSDTDFLMNRVGRRRAECINHGDVLGVRRGTWAVRGVPPMIELRGEDDG